MGELTYLGADEESTRIVPFTMDLSETKLTGIITGIIRDHLPEPGSLSGSRILRTLSIVKTVPTFWVEGLTGNDSTPISLTEYMKHVFDDEPLESYAHPLVTFEGRLSRDATSIEGRFFLEPQSVPLVRTGGFITFKGRVGTWRATRVPGPGPA